MVAINAHAGNRTRVTSMGGLYDTATLHALVLANVSNNNPLSQHTVEVTGLPTCLIGAPLWATKAKTNFCVKAGSLPVHGARCSPAFFAAGRRSARSAGSLQFDGPDCLCNKKHRCISKPPPCAVVHLEKAIPAKKWLGGLLRCARLCERLHLHISAPLLLLSSFGKAAA